MSLRLLPLACMALAITCWHPAITSAQEKQPATQPEPAPAVEATVEAEVEPAAEPEVADTAPVDGVDENPPTIKGEELDTSEDNSVIDAEAEGTGDVAEPAEMVEVIEESEEATTPAEVQPSATITAGATTVEGSVSASYDAGVSYGDASYGASYDGAVSGPVMTYYAPQYYGYYGNFYSTSVNFFGLRGWSMWRMWTPALNTAGVAPTAYPYFYAAHYAAYPHLYYNPYRYYPTYYYPAASFGASYYYMQPTPSVIITQPYMPLLGDAKARTAPAEKVASSSISVKQLVAAMPKSQAQPEATPEIKLVAARTTVAAKADASVSREEEAAAFSDVYHAYWRGDNEDAMKQVQAAIQAAPQSARAWYYKGMIELRMDEKTKAVESLAQAVQLHLDNPSQDADVNHALERVQGRVRVQLHRARLKVEAARRSNK